MLVANSLSHSFDTLLYENVSFTLSPLQSLAILGVSGSGKSSILNHLSTMLQPQKGKIDLLTHQDIYQLPQEKLLFIRRYQIGIIFQSHYLFRGFNARENLEIAHLLTQNKIEDTILNSLGIKHVLHQNVGTLSGGQQQRISIARVLAKKPKIIFADEPTGNLDSDTAQNVMQIIFNYIKENHAMLVLATHDENLAEQCNFIYRIKNKKFTLEYKNL